MGHLRKVQDNLYLVRGRKHVLALAPALEALAQRTGQLGAMHWLPYFLSTRSRASKRPFLVLQLASDANPDHIRLHDILCAALFFEYRIARLRTRVFSSDDAVGYRTIIAPAGQREFFAHRAGHALLESGAHIVLTNCDSVGRNPLPPISQNALAGRRERSVPRMLALASTFEATLAQFGHTTRFNLRYYRRRLSKRMQLQFITDARPLISCAGFESLNSASLNPVHSAHELQLRWHSSTTLAGSFVVGLRSADGNWLSLIGGWRHLATTVLHWQLNVAGYEKDSIGTVMRSFFLEHEVARGARELLIYGGTPHSIAHAFTDDTIADLLLCRDGLRTRIYRGLAHLLNGRSAAMHSNHLLRTLAEVQLHRVPTSPQPALPSLLDTLPHPVRSTP